LGFKGGANLQKIDKSFEDEFKFDITGGFAEIDFSKKWGIQPEVLWVSNYRTATELGDVIPEPNRTLT
jgi:hypothetical protein